MSRLDQQLIEELRFGDPEELDFDTVRSLARARDPLMADDEADDVALKVLTELCGLGPLDRFVRDDRLSEIIVNGDGSVYTESEGHLVREDLTLDPETTLALAQRMVLPLGLRIDRGSPMADARLPDGGRVNVVIPPVAVDGPCITIRRFAARDVPLASFCAEPAARFLRSAVAARRNIVIAGGTGAGKTTLLNALSAFIDPSDRIITVEDTAELRLRQPHVVRLEARPFNGENAGEITVRALVRNALRMRPDRLIVGEVRGHEALDMVQALNTGHEGSLSTCHANSEVDALRRLETMILTGAVDLPLAAIREQLSSTIDFIVQVARKPNGARHVVSISEVTPEADRVRKLFDGHFALVGAPSRLVSVRS